MPVKTCGLPRAGCSNLFTEMCYIYNSCIRLYLKTSLNEI